MMQNLLKLNSYVAFLILALVLWFQQNTSFAQADGIKKAEKLIFGCYSENIGQFESFATRAKASGATHIVLTAEDLPWARWQYDTPGDPYPAWAISNVGFLKIATPDAIKSFINQDYAEKVMGILEARCKVLRKLGLKAAFTTFEPQMLPEAVYEEHPLWRGPQVEHPLRSKVPRFTPAIENPEVQALYKESIKLLLKKCPEIEIVSLHTNDSGTGMSWSGGLYPGANGSSLYKNVPMHQRYFAFFNAIQEGAKEVGSNIEIDAEWVREENPADIAKKLNKGMALKNLEGPGATKYKNTVGFLLDYSNVFYPALGIPHPVKILRELQRANQVPAPRLFVLMGDRFNKEIYFDVFDKYVSNPPTDHISEMNFLREIAVSKVGEEGASPLLEVWQNLDEVFTQHRLFEQGGHWFSIGSVHQRWLTRPFVPFPERLKPEETDYFRKFQFQARSEERAMSLAEIQSTYFFEGFGGYFLSDRIFEHFKRYIAKARGHLKLTLDNQSTGVAAELELLDKRLQVFDCLINNCRNAIGYQYFLDVSKAWNIKHRPMERLWHIKSVPERMRLMEFARKELDNSAVLIELLQSTEEPLIHLMKTKEEEDIRILGPDFVEQLQKKMKIMMAHWEEHEELFIED